MSLKHILLGFLREPASGYDLKGEFETSAAYFWHAALSQIYPTLKGLEDEGLLESWSEPSDRGPDRQVYRTTPQGRQELKDWLAGGPDVGRERLSYVAQMFFLDELDDPAATRTFLEQLRATLRTRAAEYGEIEACIGSEAPPPEEMDEGGFHRYQTLRLGQHVVQAQLAWCDEVLELLSKRDSAETPS